MLHIINSGFHYMKLAAIKQVDDAQLIGPLQRYCRDVLSKMLRKLVLLQSFLFHARTLSNNSACILQ